MAQRFLSDVHATAGLKDSSGDLGSDGQVLSSTGSNTNWVNPTIGTTVIYKDFFTTQSNQTQFPLANSVDSVDKLQVYVDGVYQKKANYSVSGTTLTCTGLETGSEVEVITLSTATANNAANVIKLDNFTGGSTASNNSGKNFPLGQTPTDEKVTQVYINGVYQSKATYSITGSTLIFSTAPPDSSSIEVVSFEVITSNNGNFTATTFTGTNFLGDLNGTINTATTATTQSAGNNSTKISTTAYTDAKVAEAITNGTTGIAPSQNVVFDALALKATLADPTFTGTVGGITKAMVGLSNVDNTTDALKPVSTAGQAALDLKSNIAGPTFTGDTGAANLTLSGYLRGPASFVIDPAAHGNDTGTLVVAGNLQVDGTTTTINSTTVSIDDLNFSIATDAADSAAANGAGITIGGAGASLTYSHSGTKFVLNKPLDVTGAGTFSGSLTAGGAVRINATTTSGLVIASSSGASSGLKLYNNSSTDNAYIYNHYSGNLEIGTNNATVLTMNGTSSTFSGNVGIGGSPSVSFEIAKSGARMKLIDGTNQLNMGLWDGSNYRIEGDANRKILITSYHSDGIHLGGSGNSHLVVKGGNVGIGTTTLVSTAQLTVVGNYHTDFIRNYYGSARGYLLRFGANTASSGYVIGSQIAGSLANNDADGSLEFFTKSSGTLAERLRISSVGNVLIGSGTPSTALHLKQPSNNRAGGIYSEISGGGYGLSMFVNSGGYGVIGSNGSLTTDVLTLDLSAGNVGIGTLSPTAKLHFNANHHASNTSTKNYSGAAINANGGDIATGRVLFQGHGSNGVDLCGINNEPSRVVLYNYTDARYLQIWDHTGSIELPYYASSSITSLNVTSGGLLTTASSDISLKKDITNLNYGINEVLKLNPVSFYWIDNDYGTTREIGFVAQEIEKVVPEVVTENNLSKLKAVNYDKITSLLTKAIQEQQTMIEDLKSRIETLEG